MIIEDVEELAAALPDHAPVIGLDLGDKTIGVALSDTLRSIASPVETIRRKKFGLDAERLLQIATDRQVGGIVLGLPRNMAGSEGPRCQSTRAFARNLSRLTDLPIGCWDERLSTVAAERALIEADTSRANRAGKIDNVAASFLPQGFSARLRHLKSTA